jgi:hypothetical protein
MERLKRVWIDLSLFISNIIKMNVQNATCILSIEVIELHKQWYTLADFLPNWNFFLYILFTGRNSKASKAAVGKGTLYFYEGAA